MTHHHYTLFVDESGRFSERELSKQAQSSDGGAQIAGVLYRGELFDTPDHELPQELLELFPVGEESHGKDESDAVVIARLKRALSFISAPESRYELMRIVNNSGLSQEGVKRTYTHMLAELLTRVYEVLRQRHHGQSVRLSLVYATVKIGKRYQGKDYLYATTRVSARIEKDGAPILIDTIDYERAIKRELTEEVQYGLGVSQAEAQAVLTGLRRDNARTHPMLRLCDLVSHVSYNDYQRLISYPEERREAQARFDELDFKLHPLDAEVLAEELASHHAMGQALLTLCHELSAPDISPKTKRAYQRLIRELTEDLAREIEDERGRELSVLLYELTDLVTRVRDAERAEQLYERLSRDVFTPLYEQRVSQEGEGVIAVERFQLLNLALANANHMGDLKKSAERRATLLELYPRVSHRYELLDVLFEARLNVAVSYHDAFEFERALEVSDQVATFYQKLQGVLGSFGEGGLLPSELNVPLCGRALGASMMMERALIARGKGNAKHAHELGSDALAEFSSSPANQARVYQQFAHLEALTGEFELAWESLVRGLDPHEEGVEGVEACRAWCTAWVEAQKSEEHVEELVLSFGLMHTLRLTCIHAWSDPSVINAQSKALLKRSLSLIEALLEAGRDDYPLHALMSYSAELASHHGDDQQAQALLQRLLMLCDMPQQQHKLLLSLIPLSGALACAAVSARRGELTQAQRFASLRGVVALDFNNRASLLMRRSDEAGAPKLTAWLKETQALVSEVQGDADRLMSLYARAQEVPR